MKKIFIPLIASVLSIVATSCSNDENNQHNSQEGNGGIFMGGVMRMNEVESFILQTIYNFLKFRMTNF